MELEGLGARAGVQKAFGSGLRGRDWGSARPLALPLLPPPLPPSHPPCVQVGLVDRLAARTTAPHGGTWAAGAGGGRVSARGCGREGAKPARLRVRSAPCARSMRADATAPPACTALPRDTLSSTPHNPTLHWALPRRACAPTQGRPGGGAGAAAGGGSGGCGGGRGGSLRPSSFLLELAQARGLSSWGWQTGRQSKAGQSLAVLPTRPASAGLCGALQALCVCVGSARACACACGAPGVGHAAPVHGPLASGAGRVRQGTRRAARGMRHAAHTYTPKRHAHIHI